jgi:hypothetical protein
VVLVAHSKAQLLAVTATRWPSQPGPDPWRSCFGRSVRNVMSDPATVIGAFAVIVLPIAFVAIAVDALNC